MLLTDELAIVWEEPRYVSLDIEEWFQIRPLGLGGGDLTETLSAWIAREYPNVIALHAAATFLLERSYGYPTADSYRAEALLDFFRIAEAVAAARIQRKPNLRDVIDAAVDLGVEVPPIEIKRLYIERSNSAAHGARQVSNVSRATVAKARQFAEALVLADFNRRGSAGPRTHHT